MSLRAAPAAGPPGAGAFPDPVVELGVEPRVSHRIVLRQPLAHPDNRAPKVPKVSGRDSLGRLTDDQLFEDHPHLLDLQGLAIRHQADPGAAVRFAGDQALLVQADQCGSDRGPAGVETKGEVSFDPALFWGEAAA